MSFSTPAQHQTHNFYDKYMNISILLGLGSAYLTYYLLCVVKKPKVAAGPKLRDFLMRHCPIIREKFWPTWWCFEARSQTVLRTLLKSRPHIQFRKQFVSLPDGGHIALDWSDPSSSGNNDTDTKPTVIVLPGLTGSSDESYARHLVLHANRLGYRSVVFNYRGFGGAELKTARTYCSTNTEDMSEVVRTVTQRYPRAPVMAVGVSLGGMILTHYLLQTGRQCPLVAAMTFSVPWDVFESSTNLRRHINNVLFNRHLAGNLTSSVKRNEHFFKNKMDLEKVYQSRTIREFDDNFTCKQFGYRDWKDYYTAACLHNRCGEVKIPVLCLNAADDPFSPGHAIPLKEASDSGAVAILQTSHGGHIGFLEGWFPSGPNYMDRVYMQFIDAVFRNTEEIRKIAAQS